jgi:hypothetical protein
MIVFVLHESITSTTRFKVIFQTLDVIGCRVTRSVTTEFLGYRSLFLCMHCNKPYSKVLSIRPYGIESSRHLLYEVTALGAQFSFRRANMVSES